MVCDVNILPEQMRVRCTGMSRKIYFVFCALALLGCGRQTDSEQAVKAEPFCADSAYRYIAEQVQFGARVPGTIAHAECAEYLISQLSRFGADVEVQQGEMINYAGEEQAVMNIIGHFRSASSSRTPILLCAHWDCRPWSDQEEDYAERMNPVLGANDAASGVGILLEVSRQLSMCGENRPAVDIVFFDVEDMGTPDFYTGRQREDTWCLGSQMWAKQNRQKYKYGILLDMVASPDAVFPREYFSERYASQYVEKVWRTAANLGYSRFFINEKSYPLTDDHYYVNSVAGVPCIDIIHYDRHSATGFPHYWHTNHDDMENVSLTTIDAVGKTVMTVIKEK